MSATAAPPAVRGAVTGLIDTQRRPVTWALLAAALFFVLLGAKNLWQSEWLVAGLCGVAIAVALVYAHAIHRQRPKPISDPVLTLITLTVLAITIDRRGLVGVLWCHPLMLMLHLVTDRRASLAFDGCALLLAVSMSYAQHDADTAFRVGVIVLISSAFAHVYARIVGAHQARQEEQRQHLDLMVRCANVGGLQWDAETGRMQASQRLREMLGDSAGPDRPDWDLRAHVHPEDLVALERDFIGLIRQTGSPGQIRQGQPQDFRLLRADGQALWVHAEAIAVIGASGRAQRLIATFLDITQLRAAEADTRAALERQRELNALRERFVAMTSHEFRTPLATIMSSAELLRHYGERLPPDEKQAVLGSIEEGVRRMTAMLERILLINKADAQMLAFQPQPLDLPALCQEIADQALQQQRGKDCRIDTDFQLAEPVGRYDAALLRHVFGNLLSNAIKYSPDGGRVVFTIRDEPGRTVFEVRDQGIGIPAADLPELFEPFHRASNVGGIAGTGLGLTIVKKSVELHRGRITVDSAPGHGSCFRVELDQP